MQGYLTQLTCQCGLPFAYGVSKGKKSLICQNPDCLNNGKHFAIPFINLELAPDFTPKNIKIDNPQENG